MPRNPANPRPRIPQEVRREIIWLDHLEQKNPEISRRCKCTLQTVHRVLDEARISRPRNRSPITEGQKQELFETFATRTEKLFTVSRRVNLPYQTVCYWHKQWKKQNAPTP